ncbi:MAG: hypothetical protein B6D38_11665 [Anaerolineae bacterium UTCFX1]|jgi:hypothetical protein|nr:MAG: hypothetical protein B6D38_11665 [Anaerolineae bacterium UTCFX1]
MARVIDNAWKTYVDKTKIKLDGRSHVIDANKLKEITDREPRLLTKVDEPAQLPEILRDAGYSLLAITNGSYLVFRGSIFASVPDCSIRSVFQPILDFPLETIGRGTGEAEYLDNAFNTGLISEFTKSGKLYLTIRGRERTKKFSFSIGTSNVDINGVQIEVDAGYESDKDIILVEGKIGNRNFFNIRQLYYPYRHFKQLVPNKNIRTVFFAYDLSRATYSLQEFGFQTPEAFDSIYPIKCCVYSIVKPQEYAIDDLLDKSFQIENNIVPQADDLNKVFELLTLINSGQNTVAEIADYFVFDERQSNYYGEAAEFLGLITRKRGVFELTDRGDKFIATAPKDQQLFLAKLVLNTWFFRELIKKAKRKGYFTKQDVESEIGDVDSGDGSKRYSSSTIGRRTMTIMSWVRLVSEIYKSFEVTEERVILK